MSSEGGGEPSSTQFSGTSPRVYLWVFLFHYDVDDENPFDCFSLDQLNGTDFPLHMITGHMGLSDRLKVRHILGSKFCVFAKIQEGIKIVRKMYNYIMIIN